MPAGLLAKPPFAELLWLVAPPLCWQCESQVRSGGPLCAECRRGLRWLPAEPSAASGVPAYAPLAFAGAARALVHGLKYHGAAGLADAMAAPIVAGLPARWLGPGMALVPVPQHAARRRKRGFNQAERLAGAIAERTGLAVADCLARTGSRASQVGRRRSQRVAGISGRVALKPGHRAPAGALLVDDVITTGATLAACGRALRQAGCGEVRALAYARTPGR